jgi:hypothetical protein
MTRLGAEQFTVHQHVAAIALDTNHITRASTNDLHRLVHVKRAAMHTRTYSDAIAMARLDGF